MPGRARARERGFSLVEVVVALALLGVLAAAVLTLVGRSASVAAQNLRRTTAANLLTKGIEAARTVDPLVLPDGVTTTTTTVGGTTYTITQESRYLTEDQTTTLCDADSPTNLLFKQVTVTVTWADMQAVAPVRGTTLLPFGVGRNGVGSGGGTLVVRVYDASGASAPGARVTVDGQQRTADGGGCVVFGYLKPNSYGGTAEGGAGTAADGQSGRVPVTDVPAGYVRSARVDLLPGGPAPAPSATTSAPSSGPTTTPTAGPTPSASSTRQAS